MWISSTDQMGHIIELAAPPSRIVSLVPSQTEFLFNIGLDKEIVGVTKFCIHPADKVKGVTKVGGTKNFNIEKILSLQPDLIIGNKEENVEEGIVELKKHVPVWMSDIVTLEDAFKMMTEVSRITNRETEGMALITEVNNRFKKWTPIAGNKTVAYFIWYNPLMVAAGDTFIHQMLELFGLRNVFENQSRYPEVLAATLSELSPDYIFLSSEPYPYGTKHVDEFQSLVPSAKVMIVDGEMFSWYGSRLRYVPDYWLTVNGEPFNS
ncbi:MAG: helical backbone metal receptor [Bacteroidota bacterium]|nr:helical backbone metal receptor [Bacteroidota bacterium]